MRLLSLCEDVLHVLFVSASSATPVLVWLFVVSPMVGKLSVIMPSAIHASLLRKSLSELSVTYYVIWRVSSRLPDVSVPENRNMAAPRMVMPLLLAACIFIVTGMRSFFFRPSLLMILKLARQLWQPVSAMA